jgi:N-methylhydantoinase B
MAESGSCPIWVIYFRTKGESDRDLLNIFFINGGHGAHPTFDGAHTMSFPTNVSNTPIEMLENLMPLRILKKELIPDSGGAGRYRGGCGQEVSFRVLSSNGIQVSFRNDRIKNPPQGMLGGKAGQKGRILVNGVEQPGKASFHLQENDVISFYTPGGAGMFVPHKREGRSIQNDLTNGIITSEYAKRYYKSS